MQALIEEVKFLEKVIPLVGRLEVIRQHCRQKFHLASQIVLFGEIAG